MESRSFDVKLGGMGNVQFIFENEKDAKTFTQHLTFNMQAHYMENVKDKTKDGIERTNGKFIVRMSKDMYETFAPGRPIPENTSRLGKGNTKKGHEPLTQLVFVDRTKAAEYVKQLEEMRISPIVPSYLSSTVTSPGVCYQEGDYVIRITQEDNMKVQASLNYFHQLKPYQQLEAEEAANKKLLTEMKIKVFDPFLFPKRIKSTSLDNALKIFEDEYISNGKKIHDICQAIGERENNLFSNFSNADSINFRKVFADFKKNHLDNNREEVNHEPPEHTMTTVQQHVMTTVVPQIPLVQTTIPQPLFLTNNNQFGFNPSQQHPMMTQQHPMMTQQHPAMMTQQHPMMTQQHPMMMQTTMSPQMMTQSTFPAFHPHQSMMQTTLPPHMMMQSTNAPFMLPPGHMNQQPGLSPQQSMMQTATPQPSFYKNNPFALHAAPQTTQQSPLPTNPIPTATNFFKNQ